ncbi:protein JINGUBANG [Humulus lupulus]|uniref:protein JINGUBANG n=1 Tax=Humulus lupulus TaxID=3486 RepID=UPI002B40F428|nr:protein JINGUBANG [Humulus lupulus]
MGIVIMECHQTSFNSGHHRHQFPITDHISNQDDDHDRDSDRDRENQSDLRYPSFLSSQRSLQSIPSLASNFKPQNHYQFCLISDFKPHSTYLSSLTLAGKLVFTGSSDREIGSWNIINNNHNNNIVLAGNGAVKSLVVSGDKLFSAHQDHKIRVWKIENDNDENRDDKSNHQQPHAMKYTRLATLPTLGDRAAKLLLPKNQVKIRRHKSCTWVHHVDAVSALALSPDDRFLYSVSWDRTLKLWRTTDFKCLESITNAHDDAINAIALSHDGVVYTGSADKKIKAWRKRSLGNKKHSLVCTLEKHNSGINALALSNDGSFLYSGASDRSIIVWERIFSDDDDDDSEDRGIDVVVLGALRGHGKAILCLAVVEDLVFSGSADKTVRVWRGMERSYSCLAVLEGHTGPVKCLSATVEDCNTTSSGGDTTCVIYSGGLDCLVKVWQIMVPSQDFL